MKTPLLILLFFLSSPTFGCPNSLEYIISSKEMVADIADVLIGKYKTKEELSKLKPYSIQEKEDKWILDTNPLWKDPKTNSMIKMGGAHIEISKKSGEIICFRLGK